MFEKLKVNKKAKADEKKAKQISVTADTLESANARRVEARHLKEEKTQKLEAERWHERYLDKENMKDNVIEMRVNLYIQKEKLCRRIINANRELKHINDDINEKFKRGAKYLNEKKRCEDESKCSYYALDVVMSWLDKIDNIENEYDWQIIMKDLAISYELIHEISDDSGLLAKIAFLINNFRLKNKGKISFDDMEEEYQKDINKLLDGIKNKKTLENFKIDDYVSDEVYTLKDEKEIYDAIEWGLCAVTGKNEDIYQTQDYSSSSGETEKTGNNFGMAESAKEEETSEKTDESPAKSEATPQKNEETSYNSEMNFEEAEDAKRIAEYNQTQGLISI